MIFNPKDGWWSLDYFNSGEWQVVQEKLDDLEQARVAINPARENLFKALDSTPFESVRVAIIGQDPYPGEGVATGIAFSIPPYITPFPPTLVNLLREYKSDLKYGQPKTGDLTPWVRQGVLLWNAIPSCNRFKSLSHDWDEWSFLTKEIVVRLAARGIVFAFLGAVARRYTGFVTSDNNSVIETSHPSPRGSASSKVPFLGSRLFSTINAKLLEEGEEPINWRLPDGETKGRRRQDSQSLGGNRILSNSNASE